MLFYKPLHLEAQQVSTRIEVRRHHGFWAAWQERSSRKHGEGGRNVTGSVWWVLQTTLDLAKSGREKPKRYPKNKERWQPPTKKVLKMNTAASFNNHPVSGVWAWWYVIILGQ
jgi:hypothetical protein